MIVLPRFGGRVRAGSWASGLAGLLRHFPLAGPLSVAVAVFAREIGAGRLAEPWALALLAPFVLVLTAGYVYNDLCDLDDPPGKGNPVADGLVTAATARLVLALALAAGLAAFAALFRQPLAWLAFGAWLLLTLAYSGLGIRLKETLAGPALGTLVLWVGAPLVLALELAAVDASLLALLAAAWLMFTACELAHTLVDFDVDSRSGYRTCAQRLGRVPTLRWQLAMLAAGVAGWVWAAGNLLPHAQADLGRVVLVGIALLALVLGAAASPRAAPSRLLLPYGVLKRGWVALAILLLGLRPIETGLLLWLCLTLKLR